MNILQIFTQAQKVEITDKEGIVKRLLETKAINTHEATILLKTIDISINAEKLEMSSGAKIVGGSDFQNNPHFR